MNADSRLPDPIRSDTRPLYMQATDALMDFLSNAGYGPGDRLPTENELARRLAISRATLRVAMGYLETRGHIVRRPGLGTYVAAPVILKQPKGFNLALDRLEPILGVASRLHLQAEVVERTIETVRATDEWAGKLAVAADSQLVRCQIVESIEGHVGAYLDILIPAPLVDTAQLEAADVDPMRCLVSSDGPAPTYTQSKISAIAATSLVAKKLNVVEGTPVLHLTETFYGRGGGPIMLAFNNFLTDVVGFYIMRRVVE